MTFSHSKKSYLASDNNREHVTLVKAVSADETVIDPIFILSDRVHQEHFYRDIDENVLVEFSDSDYLNDKLSYEYIQHFE